MSDPQALHRADRQAIATAICRDVAELPDRTSPVEWPDAMLVTHDELAAIVADNLGKGCRPSIGDQEAIARVIDPISFKSWQSMYDYCLRQGDGAEMARCYADGTYLPDMNRARDKADAILKLLDRGEHEPPLGDYPLVEMPGILPIYVRGMMLGAMAIQYMQAVPDLKLGGGLTSARATWDTEWDSDPAPRTFDAARDAVAGDLEHWGDDA